VGQFQSALNSLSGEGATGSQTVAFGATANFVDAIAQRMAGWLYQANPTRDSAGNRSQDFAWASLTGSKSTLRGEAGAANLTASGTGLVLGVNRQIKANALVGLSVGVGSVNYDVSDRATTGTFNSMGMALYGIARLDNTYFAGTLAYGRGYTDMERNVAVNTLFNHQTGRVATDLLSLRVEAGYLARIRRLNLTPFVAIAPTWLNQGAISETFKGSQPTMVNMGLNFQAQQASSVPVSLGFQVDSEVLLGNGWSISPLMRLSWIHEFKTARQLDASLQLLPDQPFTVYGASAPRNVGNVLLGLSATNRAGFTSYVTLSGAFSGQSQSLQAKLGISFAL
jgi:outer membrane autotransporter protein